MEEMATDLLPIMQKLNKENAVKLLNIVSNPSLKKYNVDCYYKNVNPKTIDGIIKKYRNDFLMFGYDLHRYSKSSKISC